MRNRCQRQLPTTMVNDFDELLADRETYRAGQMQDIRNDDAVHTPLLEHVVDDMKLNLTPMQLAMFDAYDFDTSANYLDGTFIDRWDSLQQFPANAQEAYSQVLKLSLEQQWKSHCAEIGEVPQWTDDGSRNIYEALRNKDTLDRNALREPWMENRTDAERHDPELQDLKISAPMPKLAKVGRWIDLQIATISTMGDRKYRRLKHKFKDFESYYAEKTHKHDGREIFSTAPKTNRTAQQDPFFQALEYIVSK